MQIPVNSGNSGQNPQESTRIAEFQLIPMDSAGIHGGIKSIEGDLQAMGLPANA